MVGYCATCGLVFDNTAFQIKSATYVAIDMETPCPRCESKAKYLEGTFNFDANGNATLVSGPQITKDVINLIRQLAEKAKVQGYTKEQFIEEAEKISPGFSAWLAKYIPKDLQGLANLSAFFAMIIALLPYILPKDNPPQVINNTTVNITNLTNPVEAKPSTNSPKKKPAKQFKKKRRRK